MNISSVNMPDFNLSDRNKKFLEGTSGVLGTAGVLYMTKKGKFDPVEGGNFIKESAKTALRTPANFVLKQGEKLGKTATKFVDKHPKLGKAVNNAKEKAETAKDFAVDNLNKARKFLGGKIEKFGAAVAGKPKN